VAIIAHGGSNPLANVLPGLRRCGSNMNHPSPMHWRLNMPRKKAGLPQKLWHRFKSKIESLGEKTEPASGVEDRRRGGES
jgi:hypothetical protein